MPSAFEKSTTHHTESAIPQNTMYHIRNGLHLFYFLAISADTSMSINVVLLDRDTS